MKIILITGSTSYLGKYIEKKLTRIGNILILGTTKTNLIGKKHVKMDVTNEKNISSLVKKVQQRYGKLDVLINVAGITINGKLFDLNTDDFRKMLDVNVLGPYRMMKSFFPLLKKSNNPKIINISSLAGIASFPGAGAYCASKHALEAMGRALRIELLKENIWLTNILVGTVQSEKPITSKSIRHRFELINILMPMLHPEKIAEEVYNNIENKKTNARILLGTDTKLVNLLNNIIPYRLWDWFLANKYQV